MPVPKRKTSKSRRDKRSAGKSKPSGLVINGCKTCQAPVPSYTVCSNCGYYKGKKIVRTKTERAQDRQLKTQAKKAAAMKSGKVTQAPTVENNDSGDSK